MSELHGLIFDVDGTLADNEQDGHRVAFNLAFEEAGLNWRWDEDTYEQLLRVFGGKERIRYFINDFLPGFNAPIYRDAFILELHNRKTRHYVDLLKSGAIPLRPGVKRLLTEANAAGLQLAIASTTTLENVTTLLSQTLGPESVDWIEVFACGDIVPHKKPAPDVFIYALQRLGLAAADCLAIEDSASGLASARGAGLQTLITVNRSTRGQDFSGAAVVLDQLGEPGRPFEVLAGDADGFGWVDVPFLRWLHEEMQSG